MMSSSTQLMLPSPGYITIESGTSESFHHLNVPTSPCENSPLISGRVSHVSSETSSIQSSGPFEFEDTPTWAVLPDGGSVTSADVDDRLHRVNDDTVDSDVDEVPRKRQKTPTGSITGNARITTNVPVKSRTQISTIVDGRLRKRKFHRLALRPGSNGTKSKKSQGYVANQDELESWTNADIAFIGFRKPDELKVFEVEEESAKTNLRHILKSLMGMEAQSPGENVARNERIISNCIQNPVAIPNSSFYTRCDNLAEEIFGLDNRNRGTKSKKAQVPLPHLDNWSTALRSLIKGKKKFQHQDLIDLKNTLEEIYNKRANISATSSLAQEVYEVSQLDDLDVPNQDELGLRALARESTRYWGIGDH